MPITSWPALLAHAVHVSADMAPRETTITVWALVKLAPPVPVAWAVEGLLLGSRHPLTDYAPR
jgi:hypothetical protein